MIPRSAIFVTLAAIAGSVAPGVALAQNHVGINGAACAYPTVAAALANAAANDDLYLEEGFTFAEGGFTISSNAQLHTGTSTCGVPGGAVDKAIIAGNGALLAITVAANAVVQFDNLDVTGHIGNQGGNLHVDGTLELVDVVVSAGNAQQGGGIFVDGGGTVTVSGNSQVGLNQAADGGGVYVDAGGLLVLEDDTLVWLNWVTAGGGGLYALGDIEMDDNVRVINNDAGSNGGGVYLIDSGSLHAECECEISSNDASLYGGGIYALADAEIHLIFVNLDNNEAGTSGGAIDSGADLEMYEVQVEGNSAGAFGGGIRAWGGPVDIDASLIHDNEASSSGGGLYLLGEMNVNMGTTEISLNRADLSGGGIAVTEEVDLDLEGVWLDANTAGVDGGGLYMIGASSVDATGCFFHDNVATGSGGGIMVDGDGENVPELVLDGPQDEEGCIDSPLIDLVFNQYCSELRRNTAERGGGLHMRAGVAVIDRTAFLANEAVTGALAIRLENDEAPTLTLKNSLVALHDGAGQEVIDVANATTLNARNITVTDNVGTPVRYRASALGEFVRSIVWDTDNFLVDGVNSINAACTSFNGVTGSTTGANRVFFTDPIFITTARGDYRLDPVLSPEIDQCALGTLHDLDSDPRPVGAQPNPYDRGAFEVQ